MSHLLAVLMFCLPAFAEDTTGAVTDPEPPEDFSDVVLVWPDKFARWRNTRWLVATELVLPTGLSLMSKTNTTVNTYAFQVRATVACDQDYKLGKKKIEVGCKIEDFAIRAATIRRYKTQKERDRVQLVLDEIDAEMTGAVVQIQVNDRGSVTDIDLEGVRSNNLRERRRAESLRQIVARLFFPFHMKLPKSGVKEGNWPEFDSELMSMPSIDGVRGSSTIVHWMNFYKGYLLVQDIGKGVVTVTAPPASVEDIGKEANTGPSNYSKGAPGGLGGGGGGGLPDTSNAPSGANSGDDFEANRELSYRLHMNGVSIYNIDNGVMEERVWNMTGTPTASNPTLLKYWYSGRIQLLGSNDQLDLGPTQQIGYPGMPIEGLPIWLPVDPEMEQDLKRMMQAGGGPKTP